MRFGAPDRGGEILSVTIPARAVCAGSSDPTGAASRRRSTSLTGIYTQTSGKVLSFGEDLAGLKAWQRARLGIARTFQNLQLFADLTVLGERDGGAPSVVQVDAVREWRSGCPGRGARSSRRGPGPTRSSSSWASTGWRSSGHGTPLRPGTPSGEIARALALSPAAPCSWTSRRPA
jgi:hypothetical protein